MNNLLQTPSTGASAPYAPLPYKGEPELWPAVLHAAEKRKFYCPDTNLNVLADVYRFERCPASGSNRIRYNVLLERKGDEVGVEVEAQTYDAERREWKPGLPPLARANLDEVRGQVVTDLREALGDEALYTRVREQFYADLSFHISVMEDMTTAGKRQWIKRLGDSETRFQGEAQLEDVQETPKGNARADSFAYRVQLKLDELGAVPYARSTQYVHLYTNDEQLVVRQKAERVSFEGRVVDYIDGSGVVGIFILEQ